MTRNMETFLNVEAEFEESLLRYVRAGRQIMAESDIAFRVNDVLLANAFSQLEKENAEKVHRI